jgi:hypothetical protein
MTRRYCYIKEKFKMPTINNFETAVRSCFSENGIESLWYGGKEGKIGTDSNKMYIAIREDENWWQNKSILRGWFFDYEKFETLPLSLDCESYGVYVVWMKG